MRTRLLSFPRHSRRARPAARRIFAAQHRRGLGGARPAS
ncbi:hypothetical protein AZ20_4434 [Bordetella bronchiseptica E014]|nr:hypothetical protein AZ20_4434 [Bordetella bronchiseptica E014]KDD97318.1 hypothetical protein L531_4168 [Bordetella bronchiseptica MO275]